MSPSAGGPLTGVVFDLDGVLIDSEPLYLQTVNRVLAEAGVRSLSSEDNKEFIGTSAGYTWNALHVRYRLPRPVDYYQERYDVLVRKVLEEDLGLKPDAAWLLDEVSARGLRRALASSSRRRWVDLKLGTLGLTNYFHAVVAGDEVPRTKPAPDIYLRAAALAGLAPKEGMAIEDSPAGIASARAAGLFTVALRTEATDGLDLGEADLIVDSLQEIDLALLDNPISLGA